MGLGSLTTEYARRSEAAFPCVVVGLDLEASAFVRQALRGLRRRTSGSLPVRRHLPGLRSELSLPLGVGYDAWRPSGVAAGEKHPALICNNLLILNP